MPTVKDKITGNIISRQPYNDKGARNAATIADANPSWEVTHEDIPSSDARQRSSYQSGGEVKNYWSPKAIQARVNAFQRTTQESLSKYKKETSKPKRDEKGRTPFQAAFRKARSEGKKEFTFKDKRYNTKLK
jgi:hypothetical protein